MTHITSGEIGRPILGINAIRWADGLIFVTGLWFLSRFVIIVAIQIIALLYDTSPAHHSYPLPLDFIPGFVPRIGWELFSHWDGAWYRKIATFGYDYAKDGLRHSIAFFPLFPLVTRAVMTLGLPFEMAGTIVNNLAFLGALFVAYYWVEKNHGSKVARWTVAVLSWCPFSLFGSVTYTEGFFLLLSTAALQAFERRQYVRAALFGALTTATRANGAALVPTFMLVAWSERRPVKAYVAGLCTSIGLLLFSIYCAIGFGTPFAFVDAQRGWQTAPGVNWLSWLEILEHIFYWQPSTAGDLTKVAAIFGGGYLLWRLRSTLGRVTITYGFCSLALIVSSGSTMSINRFAYGTISLAIALGFLFARYPRSGYVTLAFSAVTLVILAIRFSWWLWVA